MGGSDIKALEWNNVDVKLKDKPCPMCKQKHKDRAESKGYLCKECNALRAKKWNKENSHTMRNRYIKKTYGLSFEDYQDMFNRQNGKCYICKREEVIKEAKTGKVRFLAVDHCHRTGKVRALLCTSCNTTLGKFEDNIHLLKEMINYLEEFSFDN